MSALAFHFGAADPLAYTCRLVRKACASGARVVVRLQAGQVAQLDAAMWNLGACDFLAHCTQESDPVLRRRSPVLLLSESDNPPAGYGVLVNLAPSVPPDLAPFARVIEVVGLDPQERQAARLRWKHYTVQGMTIQRHDLAAATPH